MVGFVAVLLFFFQHGNIIANTNNVETGPSQAELSSERYQKLVKRAPAELRQNIRKLRRDELRAINSGDAFTAVGTIRHMRYWFVVVMNTACDNQ